MLDRRRATATLAAMVALAGARARAEDDAWAIVRQNLFGDRPIGDGSALLALEAPKRAYDAAIVPIEVKALVPQGMERRIRTMHLVIDKNPAPVAAVFRFGEGLPRADVATRVRVNEYTDVRAVAETSDGELLAVSRYVKAAGGCSAPASKDKALAMARMGQMRLKQAPPGTAEEPRRVEVLIGHPQSTGMQIDQLTRDWIPPDYIRTITITLDGRPLLDVEADISLSEDPSIGFSLDPGARGLLEVSATDSEGRSFGKSWPLGEAS